jgi:hypothetical protein
MKLEIHFEFRVSLRKFQDLNFWDATTVERVDGAGAPTGDTSGVDLASKSKTSGVSLQHTNSKRTDDASTLAKDLLGITLVPETMV